MLECMFLQNDLEGGPCYAGKCPTGRTRSLKAHSRARNFWYFPAVGNTPPRTSAVGQEANNEKQKRPAQPCRTLAGGGLPFSFSGGRTSGSGAGNARPFRVPARPQALFCIYHLRELGRTQAKPILKRFKKIIHSCMSINPNI